MKELCAGTYNKKHRDVKIMQFGEGNFLRAFVDWILQDLNDKGAINAGVAVVQPMPVGRVDALKEQDGLYTVCLEGIDKGKEVKSRQIIDVLEDFINPYTQYGKFLEYAHSEKLETIISNTTEAGIAFVKEDTDFSKCPVSFPGKLLAFLEERYNYFKGDPTKGLAIVPCELIDDNGDELKKVLNQLAEEKKMSAEFIDWMNNANGFTSTLVDRIVPGYPRENIQQIWEETGYKDNNVVKGEVFHLWVLKEDEKVHRLLPADKTGLNVIFAPSIKAYKERKVKILNGAHTAMVPVAYLCGLDTVRESMEDGEVGKYVHNLIFDTIKPTIALPEDQMAAFAGSVVERFRNPFIRHELMSIALNATTKFRTRLLQTFSDYIDKFGKIPTDILFSFAALTVFYKGKRGDENIALNDNPEYIEEWKTVWEGKDYREVAKRALGFKAIWNGTKVPDGAEELLAGYIEDIEKTGMREALGKYLG